ncbi:MAG: T9SS type A sorting domain-containing protein [Saprospiraceae bacterium]|nr:T9SS type A sorting domain-containing protein [Saprospiraceae bacterium]
MKHTLTALLLAVAISSLQAQDLQPSIIASAGKFAKTESASLSWTLGEAVTATLTNDDVILTQGFHQPLLGVSTGFTDPEFGFDIDLYPNPARYELTIESDFDKTLQYTMSNLEGRILAKRKFVGKDQLDMSHMIPGVYAIYFFRGHKIVKALLVEKQ